jgi:hypothetical protein
MQVSLKGRVLPGQMKAGDNHALNHGGAHYFIEITIEAALSLVQ